MEHARRANDAGLYTMFRGWVISSIQEKICFSDLLLDMNGNNIEQIHLIDDRHM